MARGKSKCSLSTILRLQPGGALCFATLEDSRHHALPNTAAELDYADFFPPTIRTDQSPIEPDRLFTLLVALLTARALTLRNARVLD